MITSDISATYFPLFSTSNRILAGGIIAWLYNIRGGVEGIPMERECTKEGSNDDHDYYIA